MNALFGTARKATVAGVISFLSPLSALLVSDQPITLRVVGASLLLGLIAGLTTYETRNTPDDEPGDHRPKPDAVA